MPQLLLARFLLLSVGVQAMTNAVEMDAACHCGTVRFTVKLADGLNSARRCNCSYCRMRGAVALTANLGDITFVSGEDALSLYTFNTGTAKHYFCSKCGIYTHHQLRSNPKEFGVNAACLKGVSPFDFAEVPVLNGVTHPADAKPGETWLPIAGYLRYTTAK